MKSPTSLIRFRNAVGVMLALSAIFAVVISAVTFTQDRALGQATVVTVSIVEAELTVAENDGTAEVSLEFDVPAAGTPPTTGQAIAVTMGADGDTALANTDTVQNDYTGATSLEIDSPTIVTAVTATDAGEYTANIVITLTGDTVAEPVEIFTVTLGTLAAGFVAGDSDTVTITITDANDNERAAGDVSITVLDDSDPPMAIPATEGKVGQVLTADVSGITDLDYADNTDTEDVDENQLDVIIEGGGTEVISYQWIRINGTERDADPLDTGDTADDMIGMDQATYTPVEDDVGKVLTVEVTWLDKYGNGDNMATPLDTGSQTLDETVYDEARPFIIKSATRLEPGVVLTRDTSGMLNASDQLIDGDGDLVDGNTFDDTDDPETDPLALAITDITYTWYRGA